MMNLAGTKLNEKLAYILTYIFQVVTHLCNVVTNVTLDWYSGGVINSI